ncbi:MAG TPA: hypothetical protein VM327_09185 [Candidatus Thermoplasmatota archaeon]|nr:hypothetical protein [Candidatus Thermoplasmatota archaeon]
MRALAACAVVAMALAGCSSGDAIQDGPGSAEPVGRDPREWQEESSGSPVPRTSILEFSSSVSSGVPLVGNVLFDRGLIGPFQVLDGYGMLNGTLEWSCTAAPRCEMDFEVRHGNNEIVTAVTGQSPQTFSIPAPAEGRWTLWVFTPPESVAQAGMKGTAVLQFS